MLNSYLYAVSERLSTLYTLDRCLKNILRGTARLTISMISIVTFCGCSMTPRDNSDATNTSLNPATHWRVSGKLAISSKLTRDNPRYVKAQTLHFQFVNQDENYRLRLNGSFGIGTTYISNSNGLVTMSRGQQITQADTAEELFEQITGIQFPVSKMLQWLTGNNSDGANSMSFMLRPSMSQTEFSDAGWQVKYLDSIINNGFEIPTKIAAEHIAFRVRAVMKNWQIGVSLSP